MHVTAHDEDGPQEAEPDFRYIAADDSGPEDGGRAELVMGAPEESHCGGAPTPTPGDCLNRYMAPIRPVSRPQTQPPSQGDMRIFDRPVGALPEPGTAPQRLLDPQCRSWP
jgi:hypothetical protein